MESPTKIRAATPADVATIVQFNAAIALETESLRLDQEILTQGVIAGLSNEHLARYFVAERNGSVVGQLMITREWSDWRNGEVWWIQSVYVTPDERRSGVFAALYQHARESARKSGAVGLRLYVEHENERAQKTYQRVGMEMSGYLVMQEMFRG